MVSSARPNPADGSATCDLVIVGAGPYGLAAVAHLRAAGFEARVFGRPMEFWARQMPRGMLLRSSWDASQIADPDRARTLEAFQAAEGVRLAPRIPLEGFIEYGRWFQRQVAGDLDSRQVTRVERTSDGFRLLLEDGEPLHARRVVVAAGLAPFENRPPPFDRLPTALVSHTSEHDDLGRFADRRVIVIGAGQSAVESAVLLSEAGADVEIVARRPALRWLSSRARLSALPGPVRRLLYPPTDVGPPGLNLLVATPDLFRRLPRGLQEPIAYRSIRPAASAWLRPRVGGVRFTTGRQIVRAEVSAGQLALGLDDGSARTADHLLLATGYRIDVSRYPFLAPELVAELDFVGGYPRLAAGFESSVPGLHFLGAPAAWSFGPLMRFVSGTGYTGQALTRALAGRRPHLAAPGAGRN